jgi:hypothetical protein
MSVRIRSIWAAVLAAASFQATALADVIFDNSSGAGTGITTTSFPQLGGEVTAAQGTSRTVTELDLGFTSQGLPATADLQAFLYANDVSGGSPGTLLWQSAVMSGVRINSKNVLIAFAVPSVVVPDTFTFAAAITNSSIAVGYVPASGATTGTFVTPWVGSPGSWSPLSGGFEVEARVNAASVPEPSTIVLLGMGLAGFVVFKRFRGFAAASPA